MTIRAIVAIAAMLAAFPLYSAGPKIQKDYQGFTVWLDCSQHAIYKFRYNAGHDFGNQKRTDEFTLDPTVPYECQPASTATFSTKEIPGAPLYHRGHMVAANHLDYSAKAIKQSFFMTNVLPMTQAVNLGAWARTEKIVECYRDHGELLVLGGAVWGSSNRDKKNDYFVGSHNIKTPEFFWKVIIMGDGETIAWYIPNSKDAISENLDRYLIQPNKLQTKAKIKLPEVPKAWREKRQAISWPIPDGCNQS